MFDSNFYFHHIPKTAGTSTFNFLKEVADRKQLSYMHPVLLDDLLDPKNSDWKQRQILVGHLGLLPQLEAGFTRFATILRRPLDHLMSYFLHVQRDPNHYFHLTLNNENISFKQWLQDKRFEGLTNNLQAKYLSVVPILDVVRIESPDSKQNQIRFEMAKPAIHHSELLALATDTLNKALFIGTVEEIKTFFDQISDHFELPKETEIAHLNRAPNSVGLLDDETLKIAKEITLVDQQLWESASSFSSAKPI